MSHASKYLGLLTDSFRGRPNIEGILKSFLQDDDDLQTVADNAALQRLIDNATLDALDKLGALVGEPRYGRLDDDYRAGIRLRIFVNRCQGRSVDMLTFAQLTRSDSYTYSEFYPAAFQMFLENLQGALETFRKLVQSKPAGVYAEMVFTTSAKTNYAILGSRVSGAYGNKALGTRTAGGYGKLAAGAFGA